MGVFLTWSRRNPESSYNLVEIHRSDDGESFTLLITQNISDYTYFDEEGGLNNFYKIRFKNTETNNYSEFSEPLQTAQAFLYTNPLDVLDNLNINKNDLPDFLTIDKIFDVIFEVGRDLDNLSNSVFGREETFEEILSSSLLSGGKVLRLKRRNLKIDTLKIYERLNTTSEFKELKENFDYDIDYKNGLIIFHYLPRSFAPNIYNNLKVTGTFGSSEIPSYISSLSKIISSQKIITILENNKEDLMRAGIGDFNFMLQRDSEGNTTFNLLEQDKLRILKMNGLNEDKTNFALI